MLLEGGFGSGVARTCLTIPRQNQGENTMKWNCRWATVPLSLGLALGTLLSNPGLQAQSQTAPAGQQPQTAPAGQPQTAPAGQSAPAGQQSQSAPAGQSDQQKAQVFVGKVVKTNDGRYGLLTDEQTGKGVFLDDQEKAKGFEGKNVKVTGVLEAAKNILHVSDIQLA
jgi:hypothetical protein